MGDPKYSLLDKGPMASNLQEGNHFPLSFCLDPTLKLQIAHDMRRFSSHDMTLLSCVADPPVMEHYYNNVCSIPTDVNKYRDCDGYYGPSYVRKRNERERQRVKCVNEGYARLRRHLPQEYLEKRLSKVQTLKAAIKYINVLQDTLRWGCTEGSRGLQEGNE
ncbi:achaete-scute homolog 3 [Pelodytes ibericus]